MTLQRYHSLRGDSSGATARFPYIPLKKAICKQLKKKIFKVGWRLSCTLLLRQPKRSLARFKYKEYNIIIVTTTTATTTAQSFHSVLVAMGMCNHTWAIFWMQRGLHRHQKSSCSLKDFNSKGTSKMLPFTEIQCCVSDSWTHKPPQLPNPFLLV